MAYVPMRRLYLPMFVTCAWVLCPHGAPSHGPLCVNRWVQYKAMRRWRDENDIDHIIDKPYPVSSINNHS